MKYVTFTKKQLQLLSWWTPNSPFRTCTGVIAEGAVRSGKTVVMALSFLLWSMAEHNCKQFAICGKTVQSVRRNVITQLKEALRQRKFKVIDKQSENCLIVTKNGVTNTYFLFGGRDERSQDLIQGITLAGVLLDEVALMPRSFVDQALARCSEEGAKFWFNCNPEGPKHWFYIEHVLKYKEKNYLLLHFSLDDNPSLSEETRNRYKSMFSGIFYKRFILGEWAFAEGVIYSCFNVDKNTYNNSNKQEILPWQILSNDPDGGYPWFASDYGVYNPMVYLECYKFRKLGDPIPYFYVENEYYYDGRNAMVQKTDKEYAEDLIKMIGNRYYKGVIIDPSASSLIATTRQLSIPTYKAKNDVYEGIKMVFTLLDTGHIKINSDNCPNLISELGLYCWDEKKSERGKEEPLKQNDHACDALRYLIATTTPKVEVFR